MAASSLPHPTPPQAAPWKGHCTLELWGKSARQTTEQAFLNKNTPSPFQLLSNSVREVR